MKNLYLLTTLASCLLISGFAMSQHLSTVNMAGNGSEFFSDGNEPLLTGFKPPGPIAKDDNGNIYFTILAAGHTGIYKIDFENNVVNHIVSPVDFIAGIAIKGDVIYYARGGFFIFPDDPYPWPSEYIYSYNMVTGVYDTLAGNGESGYPVNGADGRETFIGNAGGLKIGPNGRYLYYSAALGSTNFIQKIDLEEDGNPTYRVAGVGGAPPATEVMDGTSALDAYLYLGLGLAWDNAGNLYFATSQDGTSAGAYKIKQLNANDGNIYHFAGDEDTEFSEADVIAATASIGSASSGMIITASNEMIICDYLNNRLRKITLPVDRPTGSETITTFAGSGFEEGDIANAAGDLENLEYLPPLETNMNPKDIVQMEDGSFIFSDEGAARIRKISVCKNPEITNTSTDREVICAGDEVTMSFEGDLNDAGVWSWYEGSCDGDKVSAGQFYTTTVNEDVTYYVVGSGGCSRDVECTTFELKVDCRDFFNVFTPNGDGFNDFFEIPVLDGYPANTVIVYNRWGELLEQIENYDNQTVVWEGTNGDSDPVDSGTYYFTAESGGELITSGWVEVIK